MVAATKQVECDRCLTVADDSQLILSKRWTHSQYLLLLKSNLCVFSHQIYRCGGQFKN
uniref:Uncharacterized protein n=1 Tax=Meloidogyne incognita TaxID=6306 RepID=A0A914L6M1_MELIC